MTAALYPCEITHARARPVRRTFRYHSYLWLVDLDDLPQVPLALRPLARIRSRDHLGDPASSIRANVDACLARQGISLAGGRVLMLGHAAVLGCALRHPWVTAQVTALIRWQGIRLAARRLPITPRPARHAQEGAR